MTQSEREIVAVEWAVERAKSWAESWHDYCVYVEYYLRAQHGPFVWK